MIRTNHLFLNISSKLKYCYRTNKLNLKLRNCPNYCYLQNSNQHNHSIQKENKPINDLLDVLNIRESQLNSKNLKVKDSSSAVLPLTKSSDNLEKKQLTIENLELNSIDNHVINNRNEHDPTSNSELIKLFDIDESKNLINQLNVNEESFDMGLLKRYDKKNFKKFNTNKKLQELDASHNSLKNISQQLQTEQYDLVDKIDVNEINTTQNNLDHLMDQHSIITESNLIESYDIEKKKQLQKLNNDFKSLLYRKVKIDNNQDYEEIKLKNFNNKFNKKLKSYVDVCCQSNKLLDKALDVIENLTRPTETTNEIEQNSKVKSNELDDNLELSEENFLQIPKERSNFQYISDVEIYNKVMFALAKTGQTSKIIRLFSKMSSSQFYVRPNLNSYVAALESLGHNLNNNLDVNRAKLSIERIVIDLKKFKFSIEDISTNICLSSDQQKNIKTALRLVFPNFEFKDVEDLSALNPLIRNLKKPTKLNDYWQKKTEISLPNEIKDKNLLMKNFEEQINLEKNVLVTVPSIMNLMNTKKIKSSHRLRNNEKFKEDLMTNFRENITKNFLVNLKILKESTKETDMLIYPFLSVMDSSVYIDVLMKEIPILSQNSEYFSKSFRQLAIDLADRLEIKYQEFCMNQENEIQKMTKIYDQFIDYKLTKLDDPNINLNNHREEWIRISREKDLFQNIDDHSWSYEVKQMIGTYLLNKILLKSCYITKSDKKEQAFYKIYRVTGVYKDPQIKIHPTLIKLFESSLIFESYKMPMITPPMPWYLPTKGGYFLCKSNLLRLSSNLNEQRILIDNGHPSMIYPIYDSLNTLSSCPWQINTIILDLIIDIFNKKGSKELDVPQPVSEGPKIPRLPKEKVTKEEYREFLKVKAKAEKQRAEMHSLWCSELYRLSIANMYRDKVIWFPHSLDFRGRCYPIPPHFNHLGSDLARSLILLAEGRKLGKNGLDMLKIHLINLTGSMKKSTIQERLEYANSIIDDIKDSAENPLKGRMWWQKSEEKWQTLACCMEINNALKSSNPEEFISHFPIHQDGSCNGLQHYAALGRDLDGAVSVNLYPSKRPQDVYSAVVDIVEKERQMEENTNEIARILKDRVKRKVIKQTVMTTVYNVTFYGAKLQIIRQLEDLNDFPQEKVTECSHYLAAKTFESIQKLFSAAREIQDWFSQCAYLIAKVRQETVKWETPLGLPVSQPYFKHFAKRTKNNKKVPFLLTDKPDSNKQRSAFPPNYIHSLDSCHMMLTSLYCEQAGITFISVHDCFWTHACNVEIMNKICREQFVALHSLPLLENLSKYFLQNYKFSSAEIENEKYQEVALAMTKFNKTLENVPKKGDFDLNKVLDSIYFFS